MWLRIFFRSESSVRQFEAPGTVIKRASDALGHVLEIDKAFHLRLLPI